MEKRDFRQEFWHAWARFAAVLFAVLIIVLLACSKTANAQEIMPLSQVKKGDKGYGLTVFEGDKPERFDFEVLGIYNTFPSKYIVVRLSGGPKDRNGAEIINSAKVIGGMSGSPIFKDDKIIGAISGSWTFMNEPLALAKPIENMIAFKNAALFVPNNLFYFAPKFSLIPSFATNEIASFSPGDAYIFCDIWGADESCRVGTITNEDSSSKGLFYTLGHKPGDDSALGPTALPVWRGEVITTISSLYSSKKLAQQTGGAIGSVIFNSPVGQVVLLGALPKAVRLITTVENGQKETLETESFLAYTDNTGSKISQIILGKKNELYGFGDIEAEVRIDIIGMPQIMIRGILGDTTNAGLVVKEFLGARPDPIVERVKAVLKLRPKMEMLQLKSADATVTEMPRQDRLAVSISLAADGSKEWTRVLNLELDKKYLDKKLTVATGEALVSKILSRAGFNPDIETANLLNKVSEKDALYLYWSDEAADTPDQKPTQVIIIGDLAGSKINGDGSKPKIASTDKVVPIAQTATENDWNSKPRGGGTIEILAKIDSPGKDYLITGEKDFVLKLTEKSEKRKRFLGIF